MEGVLETTAKPKLPPYLSFPVGVQLIATALKNVPQLSTLSLHFYADPLMSATAFRHLVEANKPHLVLSGRFVRWDKRPSLGSGTTAQRLVGGEWRLHVYPVRRQLRSTAKDALVATGLPHLAEWYSLSRPPSWYWGRKRFDVSFIPADGAVRMEEVVEAS